MKKAIASVLVMALLLSVVGCNNGKKKVATDSSSAVTLDWLGYIPYAQPDNNSEVIKSIENKYNVKFNFWFVDNDRWDEVLGVKLSSGDMPDYMRVKSTSVSKLVQQGVVAPVSQEILDKMPTYMAMVKKYDTEGKAFLDLTMDGKIYAIRSLNLDAFYPTTLAWRKDWLKNVGINKIPETLVEFEDAVYKFTKNDPDKNGKNDTYGISDMAMGAIFGAFGAIPLQYFNSTKGAGLFWMKKNAEYEFAATQPEMKDALALVQKWYKDGVIDPEFITGENKSGYWAVSQAFTNGKVGVTGTQMLYHWSPPLSDGDSGGACYQEMMAVNTNAKFGETFDLGKAPIGPNGKSGTNQWSYLGEAFAFTTKAMKDPRKIDVITKMIEDNLKDMKQEDYVIYGIKDQTYTINADGVYNLLPAFAKNSDSIKIGLNVTNGGINNLDNKAKRNPKLYQFMDKYKGTGYIGESVPPTEAATKYMNDLNKMALEYYINVITGSKSVDTFDDFVKTFNEKGGNAVTKEVNDAYKKILNK